MEETYFKGKIIVRVRDDGGAKLPIAGAKVRIYAKSQTEQPVSKKRTQKQEYDLYQTDAVFDGETDERGECVYKCAFGDYIVEARACHLTDRDRRSHRQRCLSNGSLEFKPSHRIFL